MNEIDFVPSVRPGIWNTHSKYENPISYGKEFMGNVNFF